MKKFLLVNFTVLFALILTFNIVDAQIKPNNKIIKLGVILYDENNEFLSSVEKHLQEIEQNNYNEVKFIFYNSKGNKELQNEQFEELIKNKVDVILLNLVDPNNSDYFVNKAKSNNMPLIFFNREPDSFDSIKSYRKSLYIGTSACEAGTMQGQMIISQMEKGLIKDKNNNKKIDYLLLKGEKDSIETINKSKCVIDEIDKYGSKSNEVYSGYFNWSREITKERIKPILLQNINYIELIIANNDEMAIGAIEALQEQGYNLGDSFKYIPVVGINGIATAIELINKDVMEGTILQDPKALGDALYKVGLNLAEKKEPFQDTNYKFDDTGVALRIPYPETIAK